MGGRGKIFFKKVPISIWELCTSRGGSQFFKNVPISIILQSFCNITFMRNVGKSKISEFDPRGGGQQFSKISEIQKSLKFPMGGGIKPLWEFFPNFSVFFMMAPLIRKYTLILKNWDLPPRFLKLPNWNSDFWPPHPPLPPLIREFPQIISFF